ncbi:MAG: cytochrome c [Chloroflexi bacterium]|nr:cytochrome c [Chloroflexota bacterium]
MGENRSFVPRMGIMAVLGLATLLIGVILLRSPYTHANLSSEIDEGYSRTEVGVVAADGQTEVLRLGNDSNNRVMAALAPAWLMMPPAEVAASMATMDPGRRLYLDAGCAKCHGLNGQGGIVGPPLSGQDPKVIATMARVGPGGMPAFSRQQLTDSDLGEIGAYLKSLQPARPAVVKVEPTPSEPAPTGPSPAEPSLTPAVSGPEPTQTVAPPVAGPPAPPARSIGAVGDPIRGRTGYASKCALCHGQGGSGGFAPSLVGKDAETVARVVRQGKGGMPAFGATIVPESELTDIVSYVGSLASK